MCRYDLNFIDNKISALALESDLVSQNRPSEESGPRVEIPSVKSPYLHLICIHITMMRWVEGKVYYLFRKNTRMGIDNG